MQDKSLSKGIGGQFAGKSPHLSAVGTEIQQGTFS
jgi:hypothetical protein